MDEILTDTGSGCGGGIVLFTSRLLLLRFLKTLFFGGNGTDRALEESALNDKRLLLDTGLEIGYDWLLWNEGRADDASSIIACEGAGSGWGCCCCGGCGCGSDNDEDLDPLRRPSFWWAPSRADIGLALRYSSSRYGWVHIIRGGVALVST